MFMKKVRGQKRKLKRLLQYIDDIHAYSDIASDFEHFHVPCGQWIESPKTSGKVKTQFIRKWLKKAEQIYDLKPVNIAFCRVVAIVNEPYFWSSQIIVFYDREYYDRFFVRNDSYQTWTSLDKNESLINQRKINCNLDEQGYLETINEDEKVFKSKLWVYGDV